MFDVTFKPGEQTNSVYKCNVVSKSGEVIAMYYGNNDNHAMVRAKMDFLNYEPIIGYSSLRHDFGDIVHKLNIRMLRKFNVENIDVRDECQEEMNSLLKLIDELEALCCANEDGSKDDEIAEKLTSFQHRLSRGDFPDDSD